MITYDNILTLTMIGLVMHATGSTPPSYLYLLRSLLIHPKCLRIWGIGNITITRFPNKFLQFSSSLVYASTRCHNWVCDSCLNSCVVLMGLLVSDLVDWMRILVSMIHWREEEMVVVAFGWHMFVHFSYCRWKCWC